MKNSQLIWNGKSIFVTLRGNEGNINTNHFPKNIWKKIKTWCSSEAKVIQYENEQYAAHVTESQKGSYN